MQTKMITTRKILKNFYLMVDIKVLMKFTIRTLKKTLGF